MELSRRNFLGLSAVAAATMLAGCSSTEESPIVGGSEEPATESKPAVSGPLALDSTAWKYDKDNDVYWQIGLSYCETPAAPDLETLGVFVPGAYFSAQDNGNGTFTCTIGEGSLSGFNAQTAPIVLPVNTPGYAAQAAPSRYDYDSVSAFLKAGFVFVYAGCRGRENGYDADGNLAYSGGAPWGATDLKAAVRYIRYNAPLVPGNADNIFMMGHSGGGAQVAVIGASGNNPQYTPYLESIGAAMSDSNGSRIGDEIAGAICWCPITCLDQADGAYEWMMGQYASTGTREDGTWTAAFSDHLAQRFAEYVNDTAFTDGNGNVLELESSEGTVFAKGSYYDHLLNLVNESLNNFLSDTSFPYTPSNQGESMADAGFGEGLAEKANNRALPDDAPSEDSSSQEGAEGAPEETAGEEAPGNGEVQDDSQETDEGASESPAENETDDEGATAPDAAEAKSVTYKTAQEYIDALNEDGTWIDYDAKSKKATVSSLEQFVQHCKQPTKDVGAFDALDRSAAENDLFGNDDYDALHFDAWMSELLQANSGEYSDLDGWDEAYVDDYASDLQQIDALETSVDDRSNMYNPLYFVCDAYDGAGSSTVAAHWRIHSGIEQGDTSLTTEANLALALQANANVADVEFMAVWGQGHTTAERTGNAVENAIAWVKNLLIAR